jgi:hypothetical protein
LQLAVFGSGASVILTSLPGISILILDGFFSTTPFKKMCDKHLLDYGTPSTLSNSSEVKLLTAKIASAERLLSGWFLQLISVTHGIIAKQEGLKLISFPVYRTCKEYLIQSLTAWFDFFLFDTASIIELKNGIHSLHKGGISKLRDFKSEINDSVGVSELQVESSRLQHFLQKVDSDSKSQTSNSRTSAFCTYWNLKIWQNGHISDVDSGSNPFTGDVDSILAFYTDLQTLSLGLSNAIAADISDAHGEDDSCSSPSSSVPFGRFHSLPTLDDILESGDPDLLVCSLTLFIRALNDEGNFTTPGPKQLTVLHNINSTLMRLLTLLKTCALRYFLPIFKNMEQKCDLAYSPSGLLNTSLEFMEVFSPDLLAVVLKLILGFIHFKLHFHSTHEALSWVFGSEGPPMDTIQPFVEAWIVGPTFLNFDSQHRTSSSLAAQEAKSSRVLFQFLSVVALIQGPFRRSDMTDIHSANSVTVSAESHTATSEADILLDLLQSKRSQYKPALPKAVIHARLPSSQAHGKSRLLTYLIFPINIFPSIAHFQRQIRTTSRLPQESFPVPEK